MATIEISVKGDAARIALRIGERLAEYAVWYFDRPGDIGDLYSGRIVARVPALAGSFVDIGNTTGFLPDSAGGAGRVEGCYLAVKIVRCAQSGKGPRLSAHPQEVESKPGLLRQSLGPLPNLAARYPEAPILIDNYALIGLARARARQLPVAPAAARFSYKAVTFDPILEDEIATLAEPSIQLSGGACMHITPTPALTAIDIDSGAASSAKGSKHYSQLSLNTALIPEITRQITLRNLSGAILIDFAGMKSSARPKLLPALDQALKNDPLKPKCAGFSHLGFAEITRPRIRPPLHEYLK